MRLIFSKYLIDFIIGEETGNILIIERPGVFSEIYNDLWRQSEGELGEIIISDADTILKMNKAVIFITNPIGVSCNDKKIILRIYNDIKDICNEKYINEITLLNAQIVELLEKVSFDISLPLDYALDMNIVGLLKLYETKVDSEGVDLLEHIVSYIKLMHQVCKISVFIFVNLKSFFTQEELDQIYVEAKYEHVQIVDIESADCFGKVKTEKYMILDKDLCIIEVN